MTQPQQPIVGQTVHYRSRGSADGVFKPVCRAAVITEVHGVFNVSLAVLNPTGVFFDAEVTNESRNEYIPGAWHWLQDCHDPRNTEEKS